MVAWSLRPRVSFRSKVSQDELRRFTARHSGTRAPVGPLAHGLEQHLHSTCLLQAAPNPHADTLPSRRLGSSSQAHTTAETGSHPAPPSARARAGPGTRFPRSVCASSRRLLCSLLSVSGDGEEERGSNRGASERQLESLTSVVSKGLVLDHAPNSSRALV